MANRPEKPHVSAALSRLRHGVTLAALTLCACALLQTLIFGFVHFTQVRYDKSERPVTAQPLSVVAPGHAGEAAGFHAAAPTPDPSVAPPPLHPLSPWDPSLHILSDVAVSVGVISTVMLATLCLLGVAISGGGAIPGVDKSVSAACWALTLALTCIPWRDVLYSMPFPGIFSAYEAIGEKPLAPPMPIEPEPPRRPRRPRFDEDADSRRPI